MDIAQIAKLASTHLAVLSTADPNEKNIISKVGWIRYKNNI
jgi:hypothetical protein